LATLSQTNLKKENMTQINKISHKKGAIIRDTNEIQRILREYFEKLYSNKLEILQ
jgi:hypothetical protein